MPFSCEEQEGFAGKHNFIDASDKGSIRQVFAFAQEYNTMPGTSACILVPDWPHARFNHYLKGCQLLKGYAGGMFKSYPVKLVYMPAKPAQMSVADGAEQPCAMVFDGRVAGYAAQVAVDSQASHCFFDQRWVQRAGISVVPASHSVLLAEQSSKLWGGVLCGCKWVHCRTGLLAWWWSH